MFLKNVMWNIFQDTGCIDAYLYYRNCNEDMQEKEHGNQLDLEQVMKKIEH